MHTTRFGIFDHMDGSGLSAGKQYEERLRLAKACDEAGFYAYHLAEHHGTSHGQAPAPNLFLAALAQRTKRMRLGPLLMLLNLYHPLRAFEEICMLDQMSGGRLELGIGRGAMPIESGFFGVKPGDAEGLYQEATAIIFQAFESTVVNHQGLHYNMSNVPIRISSLQQPRPPMWIGTFRAESAESAADAGHNIACVGGTASIRTLTNAYKARWQQRHASRKALPHLGMVRHIVIADSDEEAVRLAAPAYDHWAYTFTDLHRRHDLPIPAALATNFEEAMQRGLILAGSVSTVKDLLAKQIGEAGVNYVLCQLAFGDLPMIASSRTIGGFASEIIPHFSEMRQTNTQNLAA